MSAYHPIILYGGRRQLLHDLVKGILRLPVPCEHLEGIELACIVHGGWVASTYRCHGHRARHGAYRVSLSISFPIVSTGTGIRTGDIGLAGTFRRFDIGDRCRLPVSQTAQVGCCQTINPTHRDLPSAYPCLKPLWGDELVL